MGRRVVVSFPLFNQLLRACNELEALMLFVGSVWRFNCSCRECWVFCLCCRFVDKKTLGKGAERISQRCFFGWWEPSQNRSLNPAHEVRRFWLRTCLVHFDLTGTLRSWDSRYEFLEYMQGCCFRSGGYNVCCYRVSSWKKGHRIGVSIPQTNTRYMMYMPTFPSQNYQHLGNAMCIC